MEGFGARPCCTISSPAGMTVRTLDPKTGILYGTTLGGGRNGGVVYQIAP